MDEIGDQGPVSELIDSRSEEEFSALMVNLGGHDIDALLEGFERAGRHDWPTLFICYTDKGHDLPLAGHKDNHAGLMTPTQMDQFRNRMGVREGHEWDKWEGAAQPSDEFEKLVSAAPFFSSGTRRLAARTIDAPDSLPLPESRGKLVSTQTGFGQILNAIARECSEFGQRMVTASPDVTVSTNPGP